LSRKVVRILAFAGLFDRLFEAHFAFILEGNNVHIDVIRANQGPPNPQISYHTPPKALANNVLLVLLWKIIKTIQLSITGKYDALYAIYNVPHLYLAYLASILTRKLLIYTVIAGPSEYLVNGRILQKISGMVVRRVDFVIVRVSSTGDYLVKFHGVREKNIVQYPMLNLPAIRHFRPLGIEKTLDLIVVSMLRPDKHIELFIDIVDQLQKEIPEISAGIVGDGPQRRSLEEYVESKGLSDNIHFFGLITSPDEINKILNSAHVFVMNSSHEGAPNTIVEAMNAGVFCVSSRVGDVPFRIIDGYNGFIVDQYDDIDTYVSILLPLLRNPEELSELQNRAAESKKKLSRKAILVWRELITRLARTHLH